ncbi:hypothetical protein [Streptomyces sp. NPDC090025]|uniref:hypothetical protein n=1 Tax=Streptomyces sp. NPDC090025 TaxID=3365922 RepID=UPI0038343A2D
MRRRPGRRAAGAALMTLALPLTLVLSGCDDAKNKAGDIVSSATAAAASAAQQQLDNIKDGVQATGDVKAGPTSTDGDRTVATVTATNPKDKAADYTVMVNFRDSGGNLLDSVVLNIDGVEPGKSKDGTARSNRTLSGATEAQVAQAVRH